jgi:hypothetical protein
MFFISLIAMLVVSLFQDKAPVHAIPPAFWLLELFVLAICAVGGFDVVVDSAKRGRFVGQKDAVGSLPKWKRLRDDYGHWFVQAGVAVNTLALWIAIIHTGGAGASPFAPMLAGPAIFGAFVAQTKSGIAQIVILALAATLLVDHVFRGHVEGPEWIAVWVPQAALLFGAGIISIGVLWRDETLRRKHRPPALADFDEASLRDLGFTVVKEVLELAAKTPAAESGIDKADEAHDQETK